MSFRRKLLISASLALMAATGVTLAQDRRITSVPRYDDADEFLPPAERRNVDRVRLVLRQQPDEETLTAVSDRNVSIKIVSRIPQGARGAVLLFTGGNGVLSIDSNDRLDRSFSFLTRSRDYWWQHGLGTFVVDAPSDRLDRSGMSVAFRASDDFRTDLKAILATVKQKFGGALIPVGISNGASAVASLAKLNDPSIRMYVLLSPAHIGAQGAEIITAVAFSKPVLVVGSQRDECRSSPPGTFSDLAKRVQAPTAEVVWIQEGKSPIGGACGPFGHHSFFGAEETTVKTIAERLPQ